MMNLYKGKTMKSRLLVLFCITLSNAQTPGTVSVLSNVVSANAGSIACTFTHVNRLAISCTGNGASETTTAPLPILPPGTVGSFGMAGNIISWGFVPWNSVNAAALCPIPTPSSGTCWQIVANGTMNTGSF